MTMKTYDVEIHFAVVKKLKIRAPNREKAIQQASLRAMRLGIEPTTLRVPFLEGDE